MHILLDNCTPRGVLTALRGHDVVECRAQGWDQLQNGDLLAAAEAAGFDVLVTADQSIPKQQNLAGRKIAVVALNSNHWRLIRPHLTRIIAAVEHAEPRSVVEISVSQE